MTECRVKKIYFKFVNIDNLLIKTQLISFTHQQKNFNNIKAVCKSKIYINVKANIAQKSVFMW